MQSSQPSSHTPLHNLSTPKRRSIGKKGNFEYIVDNTMLNNYFTLRYIAIHLNELLFQQRIAEVFSQTKETLACTFEGLGESLIISCLPDLNALYLHPHYTRARSNTANVLSSCRGHRITSITQHPADRIITVELDADLLLRVHLFGPAANIFLVDKRLTILDTFKNSARFIGASYEPVPPQSATATGSLPETLVNFASERFEVVLKKAHPHFGPTVIREILYRSHISPSLTPSESSPDDIGRLTAVVKAILAELEAPKPRIYTTDIGLPRNGGIGEHGGANRSGRFSIITLQHLHGFDEQTFHDIHEAIRVFISSRQATNDLNRRRNALLTPLIQYIGRAERTVQALEQELRLNDRPDRFQQLGSLLMNHLTTISKGAATAVLTDRGSSTEVLLDPSLTPLENAQRYFEKAKRSRKTQRAAHTRLERLTSGLRAAERLRSMISMVSDKTTLRAFMKQHGTALAEFGIGEQRGAREHLPFRVFTVEGGFEVLAGKSSENNDLLTMKHSKPNDLWFHARGSSGSHVVLRIGTGRGEPTKKAKAQAASIAAYYSKMRNAKLVPVAMTERKFVRKPRGSPPGTVLLEREKVIFAEPALPQS